MDKQTALQFRVESAVAEGDSPLHACSECPECRRRFRAGARFCPYDGKPLSDSEESPADPLIGTVIDDRYEVIAVLGEGGMGVVYRVRHRSLGREFALKALRADIAKEEHLGQRFLREAQSAASINHPNVCEITDFGELLGRRPYFVMELLLGVPLSELLEKEGRMPVGRVVTLVEQIALAIGAAHAMGVVHRDLKPENVLIQRVAAEERIKVVDFGLAQVAGQSRLTQPGVVFGTPHYMSPEQASGGEVDRRADIYALGVVMYEMLTGRVPFEAETYMGVLSKHLYLEPEPPSRRIAASDLGALEAIILRCLKKKPDARYSSMASMLEDLRRVIRVEGGKVSVRPGQLPAAATEPGDTPSSCVGLSVSPRRSMGAELTIGMNAVVEPQDRASVDNWDRHRPLPGRSSASYYRRRRRRGLWGVAVACAAVALGSGLVVSGIFEGPPVTPAGSAQVLSPSHARPEPTREREEALGLVEGPGGAAPANALATGDTLEVAPAETLVVVEPAPKPEQPLTEAKDPPARHADSPPSSPRESARKKRSHFQTSEIIDPWSQ